MNTYRHENRVREYITQTAREWAEHLNFYLDLRFISSSASYAEMVSLSYNKTVEKYEISLAITDRYIRHIAADFRHMEEGIHKTIAHEFGHAIMIYICHKEISTAAYFLGNHNYVYENYRDFYVNNYTMSIGELFANYIGALGLSRVKSAGDFKRKAKSRIFKAINYSYKSPVTGYRSRAVITDIVSEIIRSGSANGKDNGLVKALNNPNGSFISAANLAKYLNGLYQSTEDTDKRAQIRNMSLYLSAYGYSPKETYPFMSLRDDYFSATKLAAAKNEDFLSNNFDLREIINITNRMLCFVDVSKEVYGAIIDKLSY